MAVKIDNSQLHSCWLSVGFGKVLLGLGRVVIGLGRVKYGACACECAWQRRRKSSCGSCPSKVCS